MPHSDRSRWSSIALARFILIGLAFVVASPVNADWLVTLQGKLIETQGPWTIDGDALAYTDVEGQTQTLKLDAVDLEGSYDTTELRTGKPVARQSVPVRKPATTDSEPVAPRSVASQAPKIILYETRWCGYCRKARKLLKQLEADFVAKDIERSREAARELREKVGRHRGVPVLDIGGIVVRGYNERLIRDLVRKLDRSSSP